MSGSREPQTEGPPRERSAEGRDRETALTLVERRLSACG
jgi:hypothetical protein